jgi:Domain of unknown function (DUF4279)
VKMTPDNPKSFAAGAAMRICGAELDLESITREIGHGPSYTHRQGELNQLKEPYGTDMWALASPLDTGRDLEAHLGWLAEILLPRRQHIAHLSETHKVDIYCYKTCYTEQSSLTLSSHALRMFTELDLPLGVSLIFLPEGQRGG